MFSHFNCKNISYNRVKMWKGCYHYFAFFASRRHAGNMLVWSIFLSLWGSETWTFSKWPLSIWFNKSFAYFLWKFCIFLMKFCKNKYCLNQIFWMQIRRTRLQAFNEPGLGYGVKSGCSHFEEFRSNLDPGATQIQSRVLRQ